MGTFSKEAAIIAQNAATAAAAIIAAEINSNGGEFDGRRFEEIRDAIFQGSISLAGAETVLDVFEAPSNNRGGGGGFRGRSSGGSSGGESSGGGSGDPGDIDVKFGKYRGKTISEIHALDADYVEWLADKAQSTFIQQKARDFLKSAA